MSVIELGVKVKNLDYLLNEAPNVVRYGTYDYQVNKAVLEALKEVHQILEDKA